jgi:hypothetical protein
MPDENTVILSEAQRSRKIPLRCLKVIPRDLIRLLPVRSASGSPIHVTAFQAVPFSTSLGMTAFDFIVPVSSLFRPLSFACCAVAQRGRVLRHFRRYEQTA